MDELLTADDFAPGGELRALRRLQTTHMPRKGGRAPYWMPKPPACWKEVFQPEWNWESPYRHDALLDQGRRVLLDCNGAFLAPLSGTELAHGALQRTGPVPVPVPSQLLPGYYLINSGQWHLDEVIVSPLGEGSIAPQVWVTAPTLHLLLSLSAEHAWGSVAIYDSWTCDVKVRLSAWAAWLKQVRLFAIETDLARGREDHTYVPEAKDAVKDGYSIAVQLMLQQGPESKSGVCRPDWHHAIRTQHMANMWRKAWNCAKMGAVITYMGKVDELEITDETVQLMMAMDKPPIRIDVSGRDLGAFKIKSTSTVTGRKR